MTFATFIGSGTTGVIGLINTAITVIFALVFLIFIWGIVNYFFLHPDDEKARASGKQFILWGLIGILVLVSLWGIINILLSTLGIRAGR